MNVSPMKWFALGALSCATCFILGGQTAKPDDKPTRLVVDELVVRGEITADSFVAHKSLSVGPRYPGANWFMSADTNSAKLAARSKDARSAFDVAVLDIGSILKLETQGMSDDLTKRDKELHLIALDDRFARENKGGSEVLGVKMTHNGRVLRMAHEGTKEVVWTDH